MAYGVAQTRGQIGATAASLRHNKVGSEPCLQPNHSSHQRRILNQLRESRYRTHNLMVPSRIRFRCATMGTPAYDFLREKSHGQKITMTYDFIIFYLLTLSYENLYTDNKASAKILISSVLINQISKIKDIINYF